MPVVTHNGKRLNLSKEEARDYLTGKLPKLDGTHAVFHEVLPVIGWGSAVDARAIELDREGKVLTRQGPTTWP